MLNIIKCDSYYRNTWCTQSQKKRVCAGSTAFCWFVGWLDRSGRLTASHFKNSWTTLRKFHVFITQSESLHRVEKCNSHVYRRVYFVKVTTDTLKLPIVY